MHDTKDLLVQERWRVIDQSVSGLYISALQSFGMDDTLCASVGSGRSTGNGESMGSPAYGCTRNSGYEATIFTRRH